MATDLFQNEPRLIERLCNPYWLRLGFVDVKRNRGAPGVDGVAIETFHGNLEEELTRLSEEIESGS